MGYDLLAAVLFVAITPLVIAGFIAFWVVNAKDHEELANEWSSFARKRGLELVAPEGEWPNRTAPAIAWTEENADFRITSVGREARVRTRLIISPRSSLLGTLKVIVPGHAAKPSPVTERPPGFADRILTEHVMRLLLGFRQHDRLVIRYRGGRLVVDWPGGERNDARLDAAMRLGSELAHAIDDEFHATETRAAARKPAA